MSFKLCPGNCNFKFSWKGNDFIGMMTILYLAGVGVFGRENTHKKVGKINGGRVLIIGDTSEAKVSRARQILFLVSVF